MTNDELKALADKITPGEWAVVWYPRTYEHRVETPDDFICSSVGEQDANFIAACSVEVPFLLQENATLTAERDSARSAMSVARSACIAFRDWLHAPPVIIPSDSLQVVVRLVAEALKE